MYIYCCCLVAKSCPTLCNPMDCSLPGSSELRFSQQEYWSRLPFLSPGMNGEAISPKGNKTEELLLKLKFQYSGHLMWRGDLLEKTLMLGNIEGKRRRGWQRMRRLESITDSVDMDLGKLGEVLEDRGGWRAGIFGVAKSQTWFSNWTIAVGREAWYAVIHGVTKVRHDWATELNTDSQDCRRCSHIVLKLLSWEYFLPLKCVKMWDHLI